MSTVASTKPISKVFAVLGNPFRVRLALALEGQEACVCHLEGQLKKRQAYISQHLMLMREAGLLETRRAGKYIYYRLASPEVLELVRSAARLVGIDSASFASAPLALTATNCECPKCCAEEALN